jgi:uncharacterized membrane protein
MFFLFIPALFIWIKDKGLLTNWLSPVVLCYLSGIIIANATNINFRVEIINGFCEAIVAIAIPMILFSLDLLAWFKLARKTVTAYILCIISVGVSIFLCSLFFNNNIENMSILGGMLAGCYTGGTPNLNAVGLAFNAPASIFPIINTADAINSGIYLIFLTTFAHKIIKKILPENKTSLDMGKDIAIAEPISIKKKISDSCIGFFASMLCLLISLLISYLVYNKINSLIIIISITLGGIALSLFPQIRKVKFSYNFGQYLLLSFCVAIGVLSDFTSLINDSSDIFTFTACILFISVLLHITLCYVFNIDADTMIITSTAGVFGPPFIGQVASAINNKQMIVSGMITGVAGLAIGNFYGIFISKLLMIIF